jgi:uncharacterized coiled-coil DUF342 family protein
MQTYTEKDEYQNHVRDQHQSKQDIIDGEAQQMNLLLELIQSLQQTHGELFESIRQLKEKSSEVKNDHQDGEDHCEKPH